jgi:tartrate dehydratase beta subunit/fumarate hydratase class I family protein
MPDYDDRKELEGESKEQATHYSKTLDRNSLYGEGKVYVNRNIAHERIVMIMRDESSSTS